MYSYDITGPGERPIASTLLPITNESTKKNEYNIECKYFDKEEFNDALDYYKRGHSDEIRYGLRFILQRIELLRSFSI